MNRKSSFWPLFIVSSLSSLLNLAIPLVLVRYLTPAEVGLYKLFFLYLAIAPALFFAPGLMSGLAYWAGQGEKRTAALHTSGLLLFVVSCVAVLVVLLLQAHIMGSLHWSLHMLILFALSLFASICCLFFEEAAIALGRIWLGGLFFGGFEALRAVAMVTAAVYARDVDSVVLAHTSVMLLKVLISQLAGLHLGILGARISMQSLREVWSYAWPVSLAAVFAVVVNYADQLMLSTFVPAAQFALYSIGCLSLPPVYLLEQSVTRVLVPQLSSALAAGDTQRAACLYRNAVSELAFFIVPVVAGIAMFAEPIVDLLFTPQYHEAAGYLRFFAFSYVALAFPFDVIPRARGEARWILRTYVISSAILLVLTYSLVSVYAAWGALASLLLSRLLMRSYGVYYAIRTSPWTLNEFLPLAAIGEYIRSSTLLFGLVGVVGWYFQLGTLWLLASAALAGLLYGLSTFGTLVQSFAGSKRVLLVCQHLSIGGLEGMVFTLARELKRSSVWEPMVFAYDHAEPASGGGDNGGSWVGPLRNEGITCIAFKKPARFSLRVLFRLLLTVVQYRVGVLHTHNLGSLLYASFVKLALLGNLKIVHTQHSFVHLSDAKRYCWYERVFSRFANSIACVSETTRDQYIELGVPEQKLRVIQNGINVTALANRSQREVLEQRIDLIKALSEPVRNQLFQVRELVWVLYLARVHPVKGQDRAIRLWSALNAETRNRAVLLFVGPESEPRELERLRSIMWETGLAQSDQTGSICFVGATSNPQQWYAVSDLFLSCSTFEGMPLAPLEACGAGLPLVVSDIPGHALLKDRAQFLDPESLNHEAAQQLERAIPQAAGISTLLESERHHNWEWVHNVFGARGMQVQYVNLYES